MLLGLLVYRFPTQLISELNSMAPERLAKVDVEGLRRAFRNILCIGGAAFVMYVLADLVFHFDPSWSIWVIYVPLSIMVVLLFVSNVKYDKGRGMKTRRVYSRTTVIITLEVLAITIVLVTVLLIRSAKPAGVSVFAIRNSHHGHVWPCHRLGRSGFCEENRGVARGGHENERLPIGFQAERAFSVEKQGKMYALRGYSAAAVHRNSHQGGHVLYPFATT